MEHFDVIIIGSGPAGEKAAAQAAYIGKKVLVVERESVVGGAMVNTGTLPSKTLRETSLFYSGIKQHKLYGIEVKGEKQITVRDLMFRKNFIIKKEIEMINENLAKHQVKQVQGIAYFLDEHTVGIEETEEKYRGDVILITVGTYHYRPNTIPFEEEQVYDSNEILEMINIPKSMVIVGAGVIGCEYACMFAALGIEITLVDPKDSILPFLDGEISQLLVSELKELGVKMAFNDSVEEAKKKSIDYEVGKSRYADNPRGQIIGNERGMLKLIFAKADKKLLGVQVIGDNASEIVHLGMMTMYFGGTIDAFINSVFNYPTLSDIYKYAAYDGLGNLSGHKVRE